MAMKPHGGKMLALIRPSPPARLWLETHPLPTRPDEMRDIAGATSLRSDKRQA